jgi:hypothetical protein
MGIKKQEPLLNTVARKLGHAAGTLTKVTQELTENLSALPENVATKVREATDIGAPADRSRIRTRHPKKRIRRATRSLIATRTARVKMRKSPSDKSARKSRKSKLNKAAIELPLPHPDK